ncbi:hypothetical protein HYW54_03425 [Candidatus Gottesmanbacteria bacterium]|nr:hypothetical protein [Candidatus Gottesmanbacteria bacterium]
MKLNSYVKLQKQFGGKWIASDKVGGKVYASARHVDDIFVKLKKKKIPPKKTVIGYVEKYGQISAYLSL